jgi:hypothetical protein
MVLFNKQTIMKNAINTRYDDNTGYYCKFIFHKLLGINISMAIGYVVVNDICVKTIVDINEFYSN